MFAGFPSWVTAGIEREWCRLSEKSISRPPLRSTRLASDPTNKEEKSNEAKEITEEKKQSYPRGKNKVGDERVLASGTGFPKPGGHS